LNALLLNGQNTGTPTRLTEFPVDVELKANEITEAVINHITKAKSHDQSLKKFTLDFGEFRRTGYALDWKGIKKSSMLLNDFSVLILNQ